MRGDGPWHWAGSHCRSPLKPCALLRRLLARTNGQTRWWRRWEFTCAAIATPEDNANQEEEEEKQQQANNNYDSDGVVWRP